MIFLLLFESGKIGSRGVDFNSGVTARMRKEMIEEYLPSTGTITTNYS